MLPVNSIPPTPHTNNVHNLGAHIVDEQGCQWPESSQKADCKDGPLKDLKAKAGGFMKCCRYLLALPATSDRAPLQVKTLLLVS